MGWRSVPTVKSRVDVFLPAWLQWATHMKMKPVSSGKLRALGYDASTRRLRVALADGSALEYDGVGAEIWRRLSTSSSPWSIYRDNIEEEFTARRVATADFSADPKKNPLDDLFGQKP